MGQLLLPLNRGSGKALGPVCISELPRQSAGPHFISSLKTRLPACFRTIAFAVPATWSTLRTSWQCCSQFISPVPDHSIQSGLCGPHPSIPYYFIFFPPSPAFNHLLTVSPHAGEGKLPVGRILVSLSMPPPHGTVPDTAQ
jgi:hypothetical protein